jgi:ADP-ribosylglycohydrolase
VTGSAAPVLRDNWSPIAATILVAPGFMDTSELDDIINGVADVMAAPAAKRAPAEATRPTDVALAPETESATMTESAPETESATMTESAPETESATATESATESAADTGPEPAPVRPPIPAMSADLAFADDTYIFDVDHAYSRAFGAFLGFAVGDAAGLQVEGSDPQTVEDRFPAGVDYPYRGAYKGYRVGDVTDATDSAVLVARSLTAYFSAKTESPALDFATRLARWGRTGFEELGDTIGLTPESVVARAITLAGWVTNPEAVAQTIRGPKTENGALLRALPCAFTAAPDEWAAVFCATTHGDSRCAASAVAFACLLHELARRDPAAPLRASLATGPILRGRDELAEGDLAGRQDYVRRLASTEKIADLGLGDRDGRSYTLKTLAVALWALRRAARTPPAGWTADFFVAAIREVAAQGGDASANCAVAGAVLGAVGGFGALPPAWVAALPVHDWLVAEVRAFLEAATPTWRVEPAPAVAD